MPEADDDDHASLDAVDDAIGCGDDLSDSFVREFGEPLAGVWKHIQPFQGSTYSIREA
jgi:hypothetical protein